jgi:predicted amidohydrolase
MPRLLKVATCQMGPVAREETRESVVKRLMALLREAHEKGATLCVFPETALTTFFPRWYMESWNEVDQYFETEMPGRETKPLFDLAKQLGVGFYLGYAEKIHENGAWHRYNTSILVDQQGEIVGKYRKIHLPGHSEYDPNRKWQHLEKRYFEVGNLGFPTWRTMGGVMGMCLCNDRRWPETWRVMGLKGVELVMLGYNTPSWNSLGGGEDPKLRMFHNILSMQAGCYQNGTYAIGVAKGGMEEGVHMMAGSAIVSPSGEVIAQAKTEGDEVVVAEIDLDRCQFNKTTVFNFAAHRRVEHYGIIASQTDATPPA